MDYKTVTTKGGDKLEYAWRFYTISNAPVEAFIENKEDAINIIKKEGFEVEFNLDELEKHKLRKTDQKKMEILESLEELELYPEDLPLSMIPEIIVGDDGENYEEDVEESIVGDGQLWENSSKDFDNPPFEKYSMEKLGQVFDGPFLSIKGTLQEVRFTINDQEYEFEYMDLENAIETLNAANKEQKHKILQNPLCPESLVQEGIRDGLYKPEELEILSKNENITSDQLKELFQRGYWLKTDENDDTGSRIQCNLLGNSVFLEIGIKKGFEYAWICSSDKNNKITDEAGKITIEKLLGHPDFPSIRVGILFENIDMYEWFLEKAPKKRFLLPIAKNVNSPQEILEKIITKYATDVDFKDVVLAAINNKNYQPEKEAIEKMNEEQKKQLNELLEALKKSDKNSIEIFNEGTMAGIESVMYKKGDDYVEYHRNFEYYSHTLKVDATNEELIDIINNSIGNDDYSSFVEGLVDWSEFSHTDNYEYDNYHLNLCSMDDDEIPEEILDDDGEIDVLKLEDNDWSFEIMDQEEESDESEIAEISINVDDKQFTFTSD